MRRVELAKKKRFKKKVATSVMMAGLLVAPTILETVNTAFNIQTITAEAATTTTVNASSSWNWNTDDGKYIGSGGAKKISLSNGDTLGLYQTSAGGDIKVHYYQTGVGDFTVGSISASSTGTQTRTYDTSRFMENPVTINFTLSITAKDVAPVETVKAPTNVAVNSAGNYISATVQAGTSTFAYDANGNMISDGGTYTDGTNAPIDLVRTLTAGEQFYVVSMNPDTEVWSAKTWGTYKPVAQTSSVNVIGQVVGTDETLWSTTKSGNVGTQVTLTSQQVEGYTLASESSQTITLAGENPTVVFYYTKNAPVIEYGTLTTKYVDETGKALATTETEQVEVGKGFTKKAQTIEGYTLTSADTVTGTMAKAGATATFTYKKTEVKNAKLTVQYEDIEGNKIASSTTQDVQVGKDYSVQAKTISGYTVYGDSTIIGTMSEDGQTVTFQYTKDQVAPEVKYGTLTTKFVDENGKEVATSTTKQVEVGETYSTTAITVEGYTVKGSATKTGTMTSESGKTETFTYVKDKEEAKTGTIRMNYVDLQNNPIATPTLHEATLGEEVTIQSKSIDGYKLLGDSDWKITLDKEGISDYYFVYDKKENETPTPDKVRLVTVFKDEEGQVISESVFEEAEVGSSFTKEAKEIEGYELVGDKTQTGIVGKTDTTVTFTYRKAEAPVVNVTAPTNVKFVEGSKGKQVSATVEQGLILVIEYHGIVVARVQTTSMARTLGTVEVVAELSEQVAEGENVTYYTVDSEGNMSEAQTLVLPVTDNGSDNGSDNGLDNGSNNGSETGTDNESNNGSNNGSDNGSNNGSETGTDNESDKGSNNGSNNGSGTDNQVETDNKETAKDSDKAETPKEKNIAKLPRTGSDVLQGAFMTSVGLTMILSALVLFRKKFKNLSHKNK
ncbi:MucBP domain-containing protein [Enterococcus faecium]|uniref:MucBP domain-containing protein n=1 Tax=Enterococcus faecium TaxID=1352 RepID=UPI0018839749|nr:MucBP domain-containing protein [Enterococcus faecium]MBE9882414.1 hypothetical protein [Enterococcus faecium]